MLVRIQGKVTAIEEVGGTSKAGRPWKKKVYTISDDFKNPDWNKSVKVNDFGQLDKDSIDPVFIYKSNHVVDETVDIVCYIETNDYGFTNLDYRCEFTDEDKPRTSAGNVVRPEAAPEEEAPMVMQSESQTDLPF